MRQRRFRPFTSLAATAALCAATMIAPAATTKANATSASASAASVRLHLSDALAGKRTVRFRGIVVVAAPHGWTRKAVQRNTDPASEADFRVPIAAGCTALAFITPLTQATATSARTQLRTGLPKASQLGIPVPQPVRIVETGARAHTGAWELIAPPAPPDAANSPDGGNSFNYFGGVLLNIAHARWAGLTVGLTARPSTCGPQVLHDRAVKAALTHLLRTATLQGAATSG